MSVQYNNSVTNALSILKSFTEEHPELTVKFLSENLGLSKSTTSRLLSTLVKNGFVYKIPGTQKFRLGTSVLSLGGILVSTLDIHQEAMPVLEKLVDLTGESAHLAILENNYTVYLCKVNCENMVQTMTHIGRSNPLHSTSSGKVLTAFAKKDLFDVIVQKGLKRFTPNTITTVNELRSQLDKTRINGYALEREENALGVSSIAVPVRDYTNKVVAAVNIVGPIQRINSKTIPNLIPLVRNAGKSISKRMGSTI